MAPPAGVPVPDVLKTCPRTAGVSTPTGGTTLVGPRGPAGPAGPRGAPGETGPIGPQGPAPTDEQIREIIRTYPNASTDEDGEIIHDEDGETVYENDGVFDNPLLPTAVFNTVAEMLAWPGDEIDTAVTLNWFESDGNMQAWQMVAAPDLADNGRDLLESDDGHGVYRTFSTRGPDADDNFVTFKDLGAIQAVGRYTHVQGVPAAVWTITHNLGRVASVIIENGDGTRVAAATRTINLNTTEIRFAAARSGTAYLS